MSRDSLDWKLELALARQLLDQRATTGLLPQPSNIPGSNKISKRAVRAWDVAALFGVLKGWQAQAERRVECLVKVAVIQEAGRDGFSVHRLLDEAGIESWVVDPASIAVDRRKRRVKTDRIDAEKLLQTLIAWTRGERRVCSMVRRRRWRRRTTAA
jgi:transposase